MFGTSGDCFFSKLLDLRSFDLLVLSAHGRVMMNYNAFYKYIEYLAEVIGNNGGTDVCLKKMPPATESEICKIENIIGVKLPHSFRCMVLNFSKCFHFSYNLDSITSLPDELRECFCGNLCWSLEQLIDLEQTRQSWITNCFCDETDEYDKVWRNKLAFAEIPNGDMLAINTESHVKDGEVVYLSHDGDDLHGFKMGLDFEDFLIKWSSICFIGGECWQWEPFIEQDKGINPMGDNARLFRKLLNVDRIYIEEKK